MLRHTSTFKIHFDDCDPAGIVFFANFFAMTDRAFNEMIEQAGHSLQSCRKDFNAAGFPVLESSAKFKNSASFGDVVNIDSEITELGDKTIRAVHRFRRDDTPLLEATELRIWAVHHPEIAGRLKSAALPLELRAMFSGE